MGRKQNRTSIWNSFKRNKKLNRNKVNANNCNVLIIDPEEQKRKKLERKRLLAQQLKFKAPSKEQLLKLKKLKAKKAKEIEMKQLLSDLNNHQLTNDQLALFVAAKHKETKKERLRRLYLTKKAGIDIDDSELYTIKATPSQIMQLKNQNNNNKIKMLNICNINNENDLLKFQLNNELNGTPSINKFSFGDLSTTTVNSLIPGAIDKEYKLNGIKVLSTSNNERKRKQNTIVLMDITEPKLDNKSDDDDILSDIDLKTNNDMEVLNSEPVRKKRKTLGGKAKSTMELQNFLECDSDDDVLAINTVIRDRSKFTVQVNRKPEIIASRMQLPIIGEEYKIMETIKYNDVVLICGETGCGKSTQIPQFLYEAGYSFIESQIELDNNNGINVHGGYGLIGITEPRRVATISVSKRVGIELNKSEHVSYQIRYDSKTMNKNTHIKFMTDGILLKEIQNDFLLNKYSVIILDEAHERNLNTDVLIGLLSRIVIKRRQLYKTYLSDQNNNNNNIKNKYFSPLKLIIMSATLRIEDFTNNLNLFNPSPPIIKIPSRQYKVTIHYNKITPQTDEEYENEIFRKICKIHMLLPKGHILVFLTGRRQIEYMCTRIRNRFNKPTRKTLPVYNIDDKKKPKHYEKQKTDKNDEENKDEITCVEDLIMKDDNNDSDDDDDLENDDNPLLSLLNNWSESSYAAVNVLPLYSLLEPSKQSLIFNKQPVGTRLIVIATNIAETSITIPSIKYVLDSGRVKEKKYIASDNMSKMVISWISKSSANQRAGRCGRTGNGHCYRLYSSNFYDKYMDDHFKPEILRVPIENIILLMKSMNIKSILKFPFPTLPKQDNILSGLRILETLSALKYDNKYDSNKRLMLYEHKLNITKLGKSLLEYPINVRCAKMLILGHQGNCLPFVIGICSLLSVESLQFMPDEIDKIIQNKLNKLDTNNNNNNNNQKEKNKLLRKQKHLMVLKARYKFANNKSDILSYLNILGGYQFYHKNIYKKFKYCSDYYIRSKNIEEAYLLMIQLQKIIYRIHSNDESDNDIFDDKYGNIKKLNFNIKLCASPPTNIQQILLRQIIASGLIDQIARKWPNDVIPNNDNNNWNKSKRNYLILKKAYQCMSIPHKPVFIHPSSYIYTSKYNDDNDIPYQPEFIVYYSLHQSETNNNNNNNREKRTYMHHVTVIEAHWLLRIAKHLCICSKPLLNPLPYYDSENDCIKCYIEVRFGPYQWELPIQSINYPNNDKYKWFARYLLNGNIFNDLKCIRAYLQYKPHIITDNKYSIVSNKAVIQLLSKLEQNQIDSKLKLQLALNKDSQFLLKELLMWMFSIKQYILKKIWPPRN